MGSPDPSNQRPSSRAVEASEIPDLLTVTEAARVLRVGRTTAYRLVREYLATAGRDGIPVIKVGGQLRVPRALLEKLIGGVLQLPVAVQPAAVAPSLDSWPARPATRRPRTSSSEAAASQPHLPIG
jgi:excisionase family DNA binding protein